MCHELSVLGGFRKEQNQFEENLLWVLRDACGETGKEKENEIGHSRNDGRR